MNQNLNSLEDDENTCTKLNQNPFRDKKRLKGGRTCPHFTSTTRKLCEERAQRRKIQWRRRNVGAQGKSECLPRSVFLHIWTGLTTLVVGFDFEKEASGVIQKQRYFFPWLHREWVPCVSVVLSSGTRSREKCLCVCKHENLTSEREKLLANYAKCVKETIHTHTQCTVLHMVRRT